MCALSNSAEYFTENWQAFRVRYPQQSQLWPTPKSVVSASIEDAATEEHFATLEQTNIVLCLGIQPSIKTLHQRISKRSSYYLVIIERDWERVANAFSFDDWRSLL